MDDDRSRSRSPADEPAARRSPERQNGGDTHRSPQRENGNNRSPARQEKPQQEQQRNDEGAYNPGNNVFVSGLAPAVTEAQMNELFEKFGKINRCEVMRDPHSRESRGFGFVTFVDADAAAAAVEAMNGFELQGRRLGVEKARRARPRTPTPGRYYGPPKREGRRPDDRRDYDRRDYGRRDYDRRDYYDRRPDPRGGYDRYDNRGAYGGAYDNRGAYGGGGGGGYGAYDRGAPAAYPDRGHGAPYGGAMGAYDRRGPYDRPY